MGLQGVTSVEFDNEDDLQEFIHDYIGGEREVWLDSANRIDILTDDYAIEVKPFLTPASLNQAAGQLTRYRPLIADRKLVIAGLTPASVTTTVQNLVSSYQAAGIRVWFVDQMDEFIDHWDEYYEDPEPAYEPEYEPAYAYLGSRSYSYSYGGGSDGGDAWVWVLVIIGGLIFFGAAAGGGSRDIPVTASDGTEQIVSIGSDRALFLNTGNQNVNVRTGPSQNGPVLLTVPPDFQAEITGVSSDGQWYRIDMRPHHPTSTSGWINRDLVVVQERAR